ncbi:hypothetical protein [Nocardiopsis composta]|uniref:Uncharacterized protein n=1 Tax=Nocardiopsis composta TaxID=157465 RepID=A0A7W8QHQ8_9ACTN|nr:hypothetical protein [Nocardiopsis composta]MBB5429945.1 hypothetical protein [Nocardiopsis composta]
MDKVPTDPAAAVGAAVDPATGQVLAWINTPGHLAHLVPMDPVTARTWASRVLMAADAAETLTEENRE